MTISSSELKKNMTLIIDGELYQVVEWQHRKPPKAPPTLTLRVKNIKNGNIEVTNKLHIFDCGKKINTNQNGKTPMFNHK